MVANLKVLLFGDQTGDARSTLLSVIRCRQHAALAAFLEKVNVALREEVARQPRLVRDQIPEFSSILDLADRYYEKGVRNAAVESTLLCICQLADCIGCFESRPFGFVNPSDTRIVGLCTGMLAAAVIASSTTVADFMPLAIEAIRIAYRTGVQVSHISHTLVKDSNASKSWSFVVAGIDEVAANEALRSFHSREGLPSASHAYISAVTINSVTISGPPSTLNRFFYSWDSAEKLKSVPLQIYGAYHARHAYSARDIETIMQLANVELLSSYHPKIPILSTETGGPFEVDDTAELFHRILGEILLKQLKWNLIVKNIISDVQHSNASRCSILALGPSNSANSLVNALKSETKAITTFEEQLGWMPEAEQIHQSGRWSDSQIAIVGMAGRFPNAADHESFWNLLEQGLDVHKQIPSDRFDAELHTDPSGKRNNTTHTPYGCFIDEPGLFDPRFFNMSPREAAQTDPMQRLALVTAYEALEMAGYVPNRTPSTKLNRIGTFYGQTSDDWREVNAAQQIDTYFIPGGVRAFAPGRINYHFKFSGPSFSIDTACSSSLAAIQLACTSLWSGDCDTAVAGGVNVLTAPDIFAGLSRGQFLSKTGGCKTFDDKADGYCRGDGVGTVILKRLEDAKADNDNVLATILGSATNHSAEAVSITHPHAGAQEFLYRKVLASAGIDPHDVGYVEMHGTGTQAGDGTEMSSVTNVFAPIDRRRREPLYLGAVKANVGHGEAAAGITAMIKILLMLQHNKIPPHVGIKGDINHTFPKEMDQRNIHIAFKPTIWPQKSGQRRFAFLNNFSAAGGNTALLLEDGRSVASSRGGKDDRLTHIVVLSAKSTPSLKANIRLLLSYLDENPQTSLPSLSYTTTARRIHHNHRIAVAASDIGKIKSALSSNLDQEPSPIPLITPKVAFVFTGQGSSYVAVGKQLFESSRQFRSDVLQFDEIGQSHGVTSFRSLVDQTERPSLSPMATQVGLMCVQIALARLWAAWGITPSIVLGHSLGEYAALTVAGVLSVTDAIFLTSHRARLLETNCKAGTHIMLAVKASVTTIGDALKGRHYEIACINGPQDTVLSGSIADIDALAAELSGAGLKTTKLEVPFAFHSTQVDPILESYERTAGAIIFVKPTIPVISPLLGDIIQDQPITAQYLSDHAREKVNFLQGLEAARREKLINEKTVWVEIGPHPICSSMIKSTLGSDILTTPSLRKGEDSWKTIAGSMCALHKKGLPIDWNEYHRDFVGAHSLLTLPTYSFDNKNYWLNYTNNWCLTKGSETGTNGANADKKAHSMTTSIQRIVKQDVQKTSATVVVESELSDPDLHTAMSGHQVNATSLCPSSLYADMALTLGEYVHKRLDPVGGRAYMNVGNMEVFKPLIAEKELNKEKRVLQVSIQADIAKKQAEVQYSSFIADGKNKLDHAKCRIDYEEVDTWLGAWKRSTYLVQTRIQKLHQEVVDGHAHKIQRGLAYKLFSALVDYEDRYRGMEEVILNSSECEATAKVSFQATEKDGNFFCSPYWIDSLCHLSGFVMNANDGVDSKNQVYISHGWESMRFSADFSPEKTYRTYVKMQPIADKMVAGDVYVFDGDQIIAVAGGVKFQCIPRTLLNTFLPPAGATPRVHAKISDKPSTSKATKANTASKSVSKPTAPTVPKTTPAVSAKALEIIAAEVGVETMELTNDVNFADIGIDSLMSLTITGRMREELSIDIPSSMFTDWPNVKELKAFFSPYDADAAVAAPLEALDSEVGDSTPALTTGVAPSLASEDSSEIGIANEDSEDLVPIIQSIIASEMGVDPDEVSTSADLASMGMDSLMSLSVLGSMREKIGMEIPSDLFAENATIGQVQQKLQPSSMPKKATPNTSARMHGQSGRSKTNDLLVPSARGNSPRPRKVDLPTRYGSFEAKRMEVDEISISDSSSSRESEVSLGAAKGLRSARSADASETSIESPPSGADTRKVSASAKLRSAISILMQGNPKTASKTIFLFPDGSGSATSYAAIPPLGADVCLYGLNCPYMKVPEEYNCGIAGVSALYIQEMRRRQPQGPYIIGGWSAGGVVAYEVALQLLAQGQRASHLILLDAPCPIRLEALPARLHHFFNDIGLLGTGTGTAPAWLLPHFASSIRALSSYQPGRIDHAVAPLTYAVWARDGVSGKPGDPRPPPAEDGGEDPKSMRWLLNDRDDFGFNGWEELVGAENMRTTSMEGNHFTVMREPMVRQLGDLIRNGLQ